MMVDVLLYMLIVGVYGCMMAILLYYMESGNKSQREVAELAFYIQVSSILLIGALA